MASEEPNDEMTGGVEGEAAAVGGGHYIHFQNGVLDWASGRDRDCKLVVEVHGVTPLGKRGIRYYRTELTHERPTGTPYQPFDQIRRYAVEFYIRDAQPDARCSHAEEGPDAYSKPLSVAKGDKLVTFLDGPDGYVAEVNDY